jgi:2-hydroxychromene-2-carboxylate isomerase
MSQRSLTIYFDFLSPFSYFLYQRIFSQKNYFLANDVKINWKPVVLAKLLTHWEIKAPAETPPKREYLFRQSLRYAAKNKLDFKPPKTHPFNPLYALRLACSFCAQDKIPLQEQIINCLWKNIWGQGKNPDNPDELVEWLVLDKLSGIELLEASYHKNCKDQLKANTQEAIDKRIFGVPSISAIRNDQEEIFWGNDSFDDVLTFLEGRDLLNIEEYLKIVASTTLGASARLQI